MRLSLRREPKGRHALGAAVTAIPSAPVRVPAAAPPPVWSPAALEVDPPPSPGLPPPPPPPPAPVQAVRAVPAPAPAAPEPLAVEAAVPAAVAVEPVAVEPVTAAPLTPELPSLPVQPIELELALLDLVGPLEVAAPSAAPVEPPASTEPLVPPVFVPPVQAGPAAPPPVLPAAPAGPRVELGFADGTFRMLDPASSAAQQLGDLVAELTGRGDGSRSSAS